MSYGVIAYAAPVEHVAGLFGSENDDLYGTILNQAGSALDQLDETFAGTSTRLIGDGFFDGRFPDRGEDHKFWYFLEILYSGFGEDLPNDRWYPSRNARDVLFSMTSAAMYDVGIPGVPTPDDFPAVFVVRQTKLEEARSEIGKAYQAGRLDEMQAEQFSGWIDAARASGRDLVLYYY